MVRLRNAQGKLLGEESELGIIYNLGDIQREGVVYPPRDWGPWTLNVKVCSLEYGSRYDVDLERCLTSAQLLDWIMQIAKKTWADNNVMAGLIRAIEDVLHPQSTLCSTGKDRQLTTIKVKRMVREADKRRKESIRVYGEPEPGANDLWLTMMASTILMQLLDGVDSVVDVGSLLGVVRIPLLKSR